MRSLTLDVKVWDDTATMQLMDGLGNNAGNEVWEETLRHINARADSWVWSVAFLTDEPTIAHVGSANLAAFLAC